MSDPSVEEVRERYLAGLRRELIGRSDRYPYRFVTRPKGGMGAAVFDALERMGIELVTRKPPRHGLHDEGGGWPLAGLTMTGERRLEQLQRATETVIRDGIPGDLIETGVWRGGSTILMRAVLQAFGVTDRSVWVADSFQGVPPPDAARFPADEGDRLHAEPALSVGLDEVRANFDAYGMLDDQVRFLPGWFRDTLPGLSDQQWAIVRLDGDLYESTEQGLTNLYPRLSPGGFMIIDDWGAMSSCRKAVKDYRRTHEITEPIQEIDWSGVYWRKGD